MVSYANVSAQWLTPMGGMAQFQQCYRRSRIGPIAPIHELRAADVITEAIQYCSLHLNRVLTPVLYAVDLQI